MNAPEARTNDYLDVLLAKSRNELQDLAVTWFAKTLGLERALLVMPCGIEQTFCVVTDSHSRSDLPDSIREAALWSPVSAVWPTHALPLPLRDRVALQAQGVRRLLVAQLPGRRGEVGALVGLMSSPPAPPLHTEEALLEAASRCAIHVGIAVDRLHDAAALDRELVLQHIVGLTESQQSLDQLLQQALEHTLRHPALHSDRRGAIFLREPSGRLLLSAQVGLPDAVRQSCQILERGQCLCGRAADMGKPTIVQHRDQPGSHIDSPAPHSDGGTGRHAHLLLPLGNPVVRGLLMLYVPLDATISSSSIQNLEVIACAIAQLIERVQLRATVESQAQTLRSFMDYSPVPFLILTRGLVKYANDAAARMFGLARRRQLAGLEFIQLIHAEDRPLAELRHQDRAQEGPAPATTQLRYLRADGHVLHGESVRIPMVFEDEPSAFLILQDVTELRSMRQRATLSDRHSALGQLASMIGHDINNPLAYIMSNLEYLRSVTPDDATEISEVVAEAQEGAKLIAQITSELRAFVAQPPAPSSSGTDLHRVAGFVLRMAAARYRESASICSDLPPDLVVRADPARLAQIVMNLVLNALQASSGVAPRRIEVRASALADRILLEVQDWGTGMTPDQCAQAFEAYTTSKTTGTGLGLHITRLLVQELGGSIRLESSPAMGTTAMVELPRLVQPEVLPAEKQAFPSFQDRRVLLVDDDARVLHGVARQLAPHVRVDELLGGASALQHLLTDTTHCDMILCDMMMPDLSGAELHDALMAAGRGDLCARIVFLTGGVFTPSTRDFLARTARAVLHKPLAIEAFLEQLGRLVERPPPTPPGRSPSPDGD